MVRHKTFVKIKKRAIRRNIKTVRGFLEPKTMLWSVVKSNAYGHGLVAFAQLADSDVDGFCVDSVLEGLKLRQNGIKKPILVLGPTLPDLFELASENSISVSISTPEALKELSRKKNIPEFHLKIDTGMHRQGFYPENITAVIKIIKSDKKLSRLPGQGKLTGIFTHFASAKDINYPTYTEMQFQNFLKAAALFEKAGFRNLIKHAAATGGTLVNKKYHLDAVRIGIGLYGLWPSKELQIQNKEIKLDPVLSWHVLVSEIKSLKKGEYVGYDLAERVTEPTKIAILPIGYWHGFPRTLSGSGEVLINGKRARVIGRVSMDMIVVNINRIPCKIGDCATIIGTQKNEENSAFDVAQKSGTVHYEFITRINPLIQREIS